MDFKKAPQVILRYGEDGVNTELDRSFRGRIDVGNTNVMTNAISMENNGSHGAWVLAQDVLFRGNLGSWAGLDKMFAQLRPKAA